LTILATTRRVVNETGDTLLTTSRRLSIVCLASARTPAWAAI
jgi:hypothetical protein